MRYNGSDERIRVPLRHLDETLSTEAGPAHTFDRIERLAPGQVVDADIDLLPIGLAFIPGNSCVSCSAAGPSRRR